MFQMPFGMELLTFSIGLSSELPTTFLHWVFSMTERRTT